ncbi:MAG: TrbC/VirB2 family protein [Bacillota bacterium]|uniref:TrbC/VIRB2 family protein n=1 Tax=Desulforamulus putei DSM 12395 TaxID=1121429 RepID=A0A1M5CMI1_9FIRM|nr:TrbC/VirB2 family protein [Desulforamulus putei]SHF55920.1 TrbC/VIRB2 family protein [Desulforamulus putei DSM 12395]
MLKKNNKKILIVMLLLLTFFVTAAPCLAETTGPDIATGLNSVDAKALADKLLKIFIGLGALSGVIATAMLIILGFKLKTGKEETRAKTKEHIMYVFVGMGVVALSVTIVGFATFLIKG